MAMKKKGTIPPQFAKFAKKAAPAKGGQDVRAMPNGMPVKGQMPGALPVGGGKKPPKKKG